MARKTAQEVDDIDEAQAADEEQASKPVVEPPVIPTVGSIVHYFTRKRSRQYHDNADGPYAALVTRVQELPQASADDPITAIVSLTVFPAGDIYIRPFSVLDVPGVSPSAEHEHESWWMWPEKV